MFTISADLLIENPNLTNHYITIFELYNLLNHYIAILQYYNLLAHPTTPVHFCQPFHSIYLSANSTQRFKNHPTTLHPICQPISHIYLSAKFSQRLDLLNRRFCGIIEVIPIYILTNPPYTIAPNLSTNLPQFMV